MKYFHCIHNVISMYYRLYFGQLLHVINSLSADHAYVQMLFMFLIYLPKRWEFEGTGSV